MLLAVGEHLCGEVPAEVLRSAAGFGGGVGSTHLELCGAFTGGVLALGLRYGRSDLGGDKSNAVELTKLWREVFLDAFRHLQCQPIYDLVHEAGQPGTCAVIGQEAAATLVRLVEGCRCAPDD